MNPKPASMFAFPRPSRKTDAGVEISNYVTSPPSENSQHLTDFQGTLEPARDFGLERREIAESRPGELIIEEARGSSRAAAEADSGPFMTSGPDRPRVIYGDPFTPRSAKLVEPWRGLGHLWLWGWTPIDGSR